MYIITFLFIRNLIFYLLLSGIYGSKLNYNDNIINYHFLLIVNNYYC